MASGDLLAKFNAVRDNHPPASAYATIDTRNAHSVLEFSASSDEFAVYADVLPPWYDGGGIQVKLIYAMDTAITGDVVLTTAFERLAEAGQDIDADGFATANTVTVTVPGTSGVLDYVTITHTSGAQMDSLAVNEAYRLKVGRDADAAGDTATGDLQLLWVLLYEV